jgi:Lipase (class 3)
MKRILLAANMLIISCLPYAGWSQTISGTKALISPVNLSTTKDLRLIRPNPTDVFSTSFNLSATGRNDINAYLLCYLSTLIYPDYMALKLNNNTEAFITKMHTDPDAFEVEYKRVIAPLFNNPVIEFFHESDRLGYDPEAMVISTSTANFVIFRGTDRVGSNKPGILYNVAEWISTDFDAIPVQVPGLTGKVITGMWKSLEYQGFANKLYNYLLTKGGTSKKLWIAGHSLGAGQAQIFAMFAAKKGLVAQGLYGFAAPNPGDQQFVNEMDRLFPNNRFQRFEFIDDPITVLSSAFGYAPGGTRVYYKDINTVEFNKSERSIAEVGGIIPGVMAVANNGVTDMINGLSGGRLHLDNMMGTSTFCYHHPTWYLKSAHQLLTAAEKAKMPEPLSLPGTGDAACDANTIRRAKNASSDLFIWASEKMTGAVETVTAVTTAAATEIAFTANTIISNVTGSAITEGDYYIISYPSKDRLGLNEQNGFNNASNLSLSTARSKVKIRRFGAIGYVIEFGTNTVSGLFGPETKTYVLDSEGASLYQSGSSEIQLWEKNNFPFASFNQRWLFIGVGTGGNKFLIKNLENGKVLDANNNNIQTTSCGVKTYRPINNDQTQIWILEKVN